MYMYICIYVYIYIHIHLNTHTHIYMYIYIHIYIYAWDDEREWWIVCALRPAIWKHVLFEANIWEVGTFGLETHAHMEDTQSMKQGLVFSDRFAGKKSTIAEDNPESQRCMWYVHLDLTKMLGPVSSWSVLWENSARKMEKPTYPNCRVN